MNWLTAVVVYILVWWVTLFAVLPLWVTPAEPDDLGHGAGAPQHPSHAAQACPDHRDRGCDLAGHLSRGQLALAQLPRPSRTRLAQAARHRRYRAMSAAYCLAAPAHPLHGPYHDREYGFPAEDEAVLFERLVLEINQAGLSWLTVLRSARRSARRLPASMWTASPHSATADIARLLADPGIVRNRLKIEAVIANARRIRELRASHGSFHDWLMAHHPRPLDEWTRLFRHNFRFTGGLIVGEFLMSLGFLPGAHQPDCPVYARILAVGAALDPPGRATAGQPRSGRDGFRRCMPSPSNDCFASEAISAINPAKAASAAVRGPEDARARRASPAAEGVLSMHDIVITGGTIIDGTGAPAFIGDARHRRRPDRRGRRHRNLREQQGDRRASGAAGAIGTLRRAPARRRTMSVLLAEAGSPAVPADGDRADSGAASDFRPLRPRIAARRRRPVLRRRLQMRRGADARGRARQLRGGDPRRRGGRVCRPADRAGADGDGRTATGSSASSASLPTCRAARP